MMFRIVLPLVLIATLMSGPGNSVRACSGFLVADGENVFAGNNEDYNNPNTRMWVLPPAPGKYGTINFGFDDIYPQGGVNEKGLFFDGFALDPEEVKQVRGRQDPPDRLLEKIMTECATVEDVVKMFERYNRDFLKGAQFFFGDGCGDSAIIEGNAIIRKQGRFQLVTNFRQSKPRAAWPECPRYRIGSAMLAAGEKFDKALCRRVLAAMHNEGEYPTLYSNIYDLKRGKIYLYHFHNYENEVVIDVKEEMKKGKRMYQLPAMFPESHAAATYMKAMNADLDKQISKRLMKKPDTGAYKDFAGEYLVAGLPVQSMTARITCQDGHLYGELPYIPPVEILPESPTSFFYLGRGVEVKVTFMRNPQGKVIGFTAYQGGESIPAVRKP